MRPLQVPTSPTTTAFNNAPPPKSKIAPYIINNSRGNNINKKMPSKEDLLFITSGHDEVRSGSTTTQDFLARDVDDLVAEIKENLRLRSRPCHSMCKQRASPYKVPNRTLDSKCHSCGSPRCMRTCLKKPQADSSDPYELLQMLLREGSLIKEAVKRLQDPLPTSAKKAAKLFYDDCDSRTPIPVHLDLEV